MSVQNENGILEVRRHDWDLKLLILFVLNENFYWKKKLFAIQERLLLKLSILESSKITGRIDELAFCNFEQVFFQ